MVGGGPAGVTAALRARELGAEVALIERGKMGGTCTNEGCVQTRVRDAEQFADYGLVGEPPRADFPGCWSGPAHSWGSAREEVPEKTPG